jgi:hypothetical protein
MVKGEEIPKTNPPEIEAVIARVKRELSVHWILLANSMINAINN